MTKTTITVDEIEQRLADGESLRAIAKSVGAYYQTLQYHRRKAGCGPLPCRPILRGKDHPSWNGGRFIDRWGYVMVYAPGRGYNKYVPEHVLVAERNAKRRLKPNEVVNHINGIKDDNRIENLLICTRVEHKSIHFQLEKICYKLMEEGRIIFDGKQYKFLA